MNLSKKTTWAVCLASVLCIAGCGVESESASDKKGQKPSDAKTVKADDSGLEAAKQGLSNLFGKKGSKKLESALGALKDAASSVSAITPNAGGANVKIDAKDVKAAIKMWQDSRWQAKKIMEIRAKNGKVKTADLTVSCNLPEMQPLADLLVADYIIAVNVLDAYQSTPNEKEAIKALVASVSLEDVAKMMADAAKVTLSMKELKDKAMGNKLKFMKDTYLITEMSASMGGGLNIVKSILEKAAGK